MIWELQILVFGLLLSMVEVGIRLTLMVQKMISGKDATKEIIDFVGQLFAIVVFSTVTYSLYGRFNV